jgi:hypothetical protein
MTISSIGRNIDHAGTQVVRTASHARGSAIELGAQALRLFNNIREAEGRTFESVLSRIGLERRHSALRPILWFAAGAALAGGAALLFTPMKGVELVERIARSARRAVSGLESAAHRIDTSIRGNGHAPAVESRL